MKFEFLKYINRHLTFHLYDYYIYIYTIILQKEAGTLCVPSRYIYLFIYLLLY